MLVDKAGSYSQRSQLVVQFLSLKYQKMHLWLQPHTG